MEIKLDEIIKYEEPDVDLSSVEADISEKNKEKPCSTCLYLPKSVYFIVITELCERFTSYGFRAILILYLTQQLQLDDGNAVTIFHLFVCMSYLTSIVGSFISDNYLGKYKTLLIAGTIYTIGSSLMSLTGIPSRNLPGPFISLILIAFGTGGVKACVAPFGGDQIPTNNKAALNSFFSMFYFAINFGALLSTIITPILRADVACNGSSDCYPLAFGVPAILMGIALGIFVIGRKHYIEVPVKGNIYAKAVRCICGSIKSWYRDRLTNPKKNLLDYASNEYDEEFISDLRRLYHIVILFLPLPAYWALLEQLGSRWTLQAILMDGEITPHLTILPDQMFIFNVLLVAIMILIFNVCIYPIVYKFNQKLRPLGRMTVGFFFTALAFLAAFLLQRHIEGLQPPKIASLHSRLVLINDQQCELSIFVSDGRLLQASSYQLSALYLDVLSGEQQIQVQISKCGTMVATTSINRTVTLTPGQINFVVISTDSANSAAIRIITDSQNPNIKGYPLIKLTVSSKSLDKFQFQLRNSITDKVEKQFTVVNDASPFASNWEMLSKPGRYVWDVKAPDGYYSNQTSVWTRALIVGHKVNHQKIVSSEVSIFYMTFSNQLGFVISIPLTLHGGTQISILWQLPQYLLISVGEVLVNIPGLTFSYDQAPIGMKSLVNSLWYMCDATGNLIVMIVAKIHPVDKQSIEFLIFAIICVIFNVIFGVLAYYYPMKEREEYIRIE